MNIPIFLTICFGCAGLGYIIFWQYQKRQQQIPFLWILSSAIIFRAIGVLGEPILEDDFYRYLWDGYRMAVSGDPYSIAPAEYFSRNDIAPVFESILSRINYPDVATVYGPVSQWIFALGYLIAPGQVWPLQLTAALADVGVLLLLRSLCKHNILLLYAWCPLLIKEFAFTAHPDAAAIFLSVAAMVSLVSARVAVSGIFLALATGVKVFALLLLPLFLIYHPPWRKPLLLLACYLATIGLISALFGSAGIWYPEGLSAMAQSWVFNSPIYFLLTPIIPFSGLKLGLLLLFCFLFGFYGIRILLHRVGVGWDSRDKRSVRGDLVFGLFLLCSPVLNPWYLPWILPFAVLYPARWPWVASYAILLSYLIQSTTGQSDLGQSDLGQYWLPAQLHLLEFGVILVAILWDWWRPLPIRSNRV